MRLKQRLSFYPLGLIARVHLVSGRKIEAQIVKIETTVLGAFLHIEHDEEVANVTCKFLFLTQTYINLKKWEHSESLSQTCKRMYRTILYLAFRIPVPARHSHYSIPTLDRERNQF